MMRLGAALLILLAGLGLGFYGGAEGAGWLPAAAQRWLGGGTDVTSVAQSSLEAVRAQSRLNVFAARFTVAVTSRQSRFGLEGRKTMIVPGLVRYELDLARMQADDLRWDEASRTLLVTVPDVEISAPQVDHRGVQEYSDGRMLFALTDAESALDAANREKIEEALTAQARAPTMVRLARDAAAMAAERMFLLPLRGAGVDARIEVRFEHEAAAAS